MPKRAAPSTPVKSAAVRGGRGTRKENLSAGWLAYPGEPDEETVKLAGWTWSELYYGVHTRRVFKLVKKTGEWFRFAFIQAEDARVNLD